MKLKKDASLQENLLAAVSDVAESLACIEREQESFIEIGCYLYRASLAAIELLVTEYPPNNKEIAQSLSESINLAKDLIKKCQKDGHVDEYAEPRVIALLEKEIKHIGYCLSIIPSSTFWEKEYAEVVVRSLSSEMQNASFDKSQVFDTEKLLIEKQPKEEPTLNDKDLHSINFELPVEGPQFLNMVPMIQAPQSETLFYEEKYGNLSRSLTALPEVAEYIEPLYETFLCPLTRRLMDDPVTIESGVTFERKAISEWFDKCENPDEIFCPITRQKLQIREFKTNIALKSTIAEWKERNEAARIRVARAALFLSSSDGMVLEAINDLQNVCQKSQHNRLQVQNMGMWPLLLNFLDSKNGDVVRATLELLRQLVEDDDQSKEMLAESTDISKIVKMLSNSHKPSKHASLMLLLELSRILSVCEKIGSATGGILMLIMIKYKTAEDVFASEKADAILKNLERLPSNIKHMAENGFLEPLLNHLAEGSDEMKD